MPLEAGHAAEAVHPASLPAFVGAEGVFVPNPNLARASPGTEILDLDALESDAEIGYVYDGIRAYPYRFPYNKTAQPYNSGGVPTKPSDMTLKVYLRRSVGPSTAESTH